MRPDCNNCANSNCKGRNDVQNCSKWMKPKSGWMLAELALEHPQGLHDVLSSLPFDTDLSFCLDK